MPDSLEENVSCRICLDPKDSYVSLFSHDLSLKVMEVANVQVEKDDGLPGSICTECEYDLEKCYEFRLKVQDADKKLRGNIRMAQFDIEECNIKEEQYGDDGHSDDGDDRDSGSVDDEQFDEEPDVEKNPETTEEATPDPLNHVVVVEEKERKTEMAEEPLNQDEAMAEEVKVQKIEEVALDALSCMKEETETEIMDVDSNQPDPFGPSSSVMSSDLPNSYYNPPSTLQSGKRKQRTSPNYRAQGQRKFARNQKSKSVVLLPQLGMNLDCRLFIPYVNIDVKYNTAPQSSVNNSQDPNGTSIPKSTLQFKTTKNGESDISAGSCSYENSPKVTSQPRFIVEHSINKTPGFGENHLLQVEVRNESDKDCLGSATLGSPSPLKSLTEEGKEEVREEYFCSVCNIDFGFPYLLEEHKNGKEFICRNCTAIFDNHLELEIHFFSHKQFKCEFCGKVFHVKKDLFNHKRTEIKCNKKSLKERCEVCNTRLGSRDSLLRHMERRHPVIEQGPFCCPLCSSRFKIEHHLKRHMLVNHEVYEGIECEVCHKIVIGPIKLKFHIKGRHLQSPEICPICNKVLASKFTLKQHMQSHDGEEKICYICGAKVKGEASFRYHMYNHKDTRKTCGICNITFNSSSEKNKHYREIHMKSKVTPSMCELCGKEFKNPTILKNHMMTHSDVKPYECSECGATFKTKAVLKTHSRVHTGFKKYTCNSCGEGFKWRPTFAKHMLKCGNKEEATHNDDAASSS